jgi:hypothetical protein
VQLSVLLPTHRHDLLACSRIAQVCSWAAPDIEVIVRDNSGDAQKRELLGRFNRLQPDNCDIVIAEPCNALENFSELLRMAKGEFIYVVADDDFGFDRALAPLSRMLAETGTDPSVAGVTGAYLIERSNGSSIANYQDLDSADVAARVTGYLKYPGPNVLIYSVVRRELAKRIVAFMGTMPFQYSFHDQIVCLLYLLNGKFLRLQRMLYLYDAGLWEVTETAQKRDLDFYTAAGLDPAINKLHWFLCGFEGAALIRNADSFPDYPMAQRQPIANLWFSAMFQRFKSQKRLAFGSELAAEAEKVCAKLRTSTGQMSFSDMLTEVSGFIALFSKDGAQHYFEFWDAVVNKRIPAAPSLAAAGGR